MHISITCAYIAFKVCTCAIICTRPVHRRLYISLRTCSRMSMCIRTCIPTATCKHTTTCTTHAHTSTSHCPCTHLQHCHHQLLAPDLTHILDHVQVPSFTRRHQAGPTLLQTLAVRQEHHMLRPTAPPSHSRPSLPDCPHPPHTNGCPKDSATCDCLVVESQCACVCTCDMHV